MKFNNFKEFMNIYGTNSTTNFQLTKYAKELKIKNFYCLMRNELEQIDTVKSVYNVLCL